jgi:hypothetical protein
MKACRRCGKTKPLADFHRHSRHGHQAWCKPCRAAYAAAHYQTNKARRYAHNRRRQLEFRKWYIGLKSGRPCADCGEVFHPAAMQWDHLPGSEKAGSLGDLVRHGNRRLILQEIEKCELVCANCHAVRSAMRAQGAADLAAAQGNLTD